MSLDTNPLARGVCSRLDESLNELPRSVAERLSVARCAALSPSSTKTKKPAQSWLNYLVPQSGRWVMPAMFVAGVLGFLGYEQYQHLQEQDDFDVDIALLSSDLPIDAYLDRGFNNWVQDNNNHNHP